MNDIEYVLKNGLQYASTAGNQHPIVFEAMKGDGNAGHFMFWSQWGCGPVDAVRVYMTVRRYGWRVKNMWLCVGDHRIAGIVVKDKPVAVTYDEAMIHTLEWLGGFRRPE